jgi:hypothetical protein
MTTQPTPPAQKQPLTPREQLESRLLEARQFRAATVGRLLHAREQVKGLEDAAATSQGAIVELEFAISLLPSGAPKA